jgi:hypothetical protein
MDQLAVAEGADDGVIGRRVECDDGAESHGWAGRPTRVPAFSLGAQRRVKAKAPTR